MKQPENNMSDYYEDQATNDTAHGGNCLTESDIDANEREERAIAACDHVRRSVYAGTDFLLQALRKGGVL